MIRRSFVSAITGFMVAVGVFFASNNAAHATPPTAQFSFNLSTSPGSNTTVTQLNGATPVAPTFTMGTLNGELFGSGGSITSFVGTFDGAPITISSGVTGSYTDVGGVRLLTGLTMNYTVGSVTYQFAASVPAGGVGNTNSFTSSLVRTAGTNPTLVVASQTYVLGVPEIDGSVLARASLILGGFAALMLLGARSRRQSYLSAA